MTRLPQEEWHTFLPGAHAGYIEWDEYERNLRRMRENARHYDPERKVPPREGFIRLQHTGGFWEFVPDGGKRSKVTFETYVDLGGSLPGWLVSGMMSDTAIGNFEDVANEAVKKQ